MADEKLHEPTTKRREQARREGQFPRGSDLTGIAVVISGLAAILCFGPWWFESLGQLWTTAMPDQPRIAISPQEAVGEFRNTLWLVGKATLPPMALFLSVAMVTQWAQVGWNWLPERITPDLTRVNPMTRLASPFDLLRWTDGLLVLVRYVVGLAVGIGTLWCFRHWTGPGPEQTKLMFGRAAQTAVAVVFHATVGLAVVSVLEYGYRWWSFEGNLRMTADEVRQDSKEQEGDLRVRSLRRGVHQQMARRRGQVANEEREEVGGRQ